MHAAEILDTLPEKPTAVLASNDMMAIGCLIRLKELGYHVPQEISVMGIDDITMTRFVDPPLTTISLPLYDLGAHGMEALVKLRSGELTHEDCVVLPHQLVIRKSTASPPV